MLINADCTFYEKYTYTAHPVKDVYWNDSRGRTVSKGGIQITDQLIVYLYTDEYIPKAGDIVVRGINDFRFDTSTPQAASQSLKAFRESCPEFAVVKNVADARYGGLPHIEVSAR